MCGILGVLWVVLISVLGLKELNSGKFGWLVYRCSILWLMILLVFSFCLVVGLILMFSVWLLVM